MEDKSNFELLEEFAEEAGKELVYEETPYPEPDYRKILRKYRRIAYIFDKDARGTNLVFYGDPYKLIGEHAAFFGAFKTSEMSKDIRLCMRRKDILDKLNFSLRKVGVRRFDSKFVVCKKDMDVPVSLTGNLTAQEMIEESLRIYNNLHFSINYVDVGFVPNLKGLSTIGIYHPDAWVVDKEILGKMLNHIELIGNKLD